MLPLIRTGCVKDAEIVSLAERLAPLQKHLDGTRKEFEEKKSVILIAEKDFSDVRHYVEGLPLYE